MSYLKKIERSGKKLLVKILKFVFPARTGVDAAQLKKAHIKKILIIRLEQKLGNLVMTTFFPRALKDIYPEADIDILVHESLKTIWDNNPFVSRLVIFSHKKHLHNPVRLIKFLYLLRRSRYDLVMDCSTPGGFSLSNGLLARLTGAPFQAGFKRGESDHFLNATVSPDQTKHYVDILHDLLDLFTSDKKRYQPEIFLTDKETSSAHEKLASSGINTCNNLIFIWVGARHIKQWEIEHFKSLAKSLRGASDVRVLYLCGPQEKQLYDDLSGEEPGKALYIDDFRELTALIQQCSLFVSGDAGPLHLAAALDIDTVGIFLQNNYTMYGYDDGKKHRIVDLSNDRDNVQKVIDICREVLNISNKLHKNPSK
ncbi:hypothetical protein AMJ80_05095 [bacterium SM23_31]|nr:MAG: hypothetical protein AMJ80_05095 [bacterium SM23_31]